MTPTDSDLVAQAHGGSQAACREIVRRHQRPIYNLIVRMVRDRALAEDLAQETFLKAFTHLAGFDARFKLSNWLLKIAHNTVIDYLRQQRHPVVSLDASAPDEPEGAAQVVDAAAVDPLETLEREELARAIEQAVARLRPVYRQAIILRYHEDLSHEEIAGIMEIPVGTVKSYLHRARADLAKLLGEAASAARRRASAGRSATGTPPGP